MYIHTFIFPYWVPIMLLVYIFSCLIIWHWTANYCSLPWGRPPLLLPAFLIAFGSLCRVEVWQTFLHSVWHVHWCPLGSWFTSHFSGHIGDTLQVQLLMLLGNTISQRMLNLWLLQPFCLFCCPLSLEWGSVLHMCSLVLVSTSMYFDWMCFPPVVSRRSIPMIWIWYIDHN